MGSDRDPFYSRRHVLRSLGGAAGLYGKNARTYGDWAGSRQDDPAQIDPNDLLSEFQDNILDRVLQQIATIGLEQILEIVDHIGRGVADAVDTVGELVDDVLWIQNNATQLWEAVYDAIEASEDEQDDEDSDSGASGGSEGQSKVANGPSRRWAKSTSRPPFDSGGWGVDINIDVDIPDMPNMEDLQDEYENLEENLGDAYDDFIDRFDEIPTPDEIMSWVEEAYSTVAGWFMELVPDIEFPDDVDDFASMFPWSYSIDFDTFDFEDLFGLSDTHEISLPLADPDGDTSLYGRAATTGPAASGAAPSATGSIVGSPKASVSARQEDDAIDQLTDQVSHLDLVNCNNVPSPVPAVPVRFNWSDGMSHSIPGPCGNPAMPSATVWMGWHADVSNCVFIGTDASLGCSVSIQDVADIANEYQDDLRSFGEEFLERVIPAIEAVSRYNNGDPYVILEAIESIQDLEDLVESIDQAMQDIMVDPKDLGDVVDRLLRDDERSTNEGELGHTADDVGALERLRLVHEDLHTRLEEVAPGLPFHRVEEFADEVEATGLAYPYSDLRDKKDEVERMVDSHQANPGRVQYDLAWDIEEESAALAEMLYNLATSHSDVADQTPFTTADIEAVAEEFERYTPLEIDVREGVDGAFDSAINNAAMNLQSIIEAYSQYTYTLGDPFPELGCRRFCSESGRPQPVPAPDAAYVADEMAQRAMQQAQEGTGSGDGGGGLFPDVEITLPGPLKALIAFAIILAAIVLLVYTLIALGVITVGSGGSGSWFTIPAGYAAIVFVAGVIGFFGSWLA